MICSSWLNYKKERQFVQTQQKLSGELGSDGESPYDQSTNDVANSSGLPTIIDEHLNVPIASERQSPNDWSRHSSIASETSLDPLDFVYSYIDVEKLIMQHLRNRIQQLNEVGIVDTNMFESSNDLRNSTRTGRPKSASKAEATIGLSTVATPTAAPRPTESQCKAADHTEDHEPLKRSGGGGIMKKRRSTGADTRSRVRSSVLGVCRPDEPYWMTFLRVCEEDFERYHSQLVADPMQSCALKENLLNYANCVTNNWVLGLIQREIDARNRTLSSSFEKRCPDSARTSQSRSNRCRAQCKRPDCPRMHLPKTVYIVNLVPNQINVFRHCLFLKQMPNMSAFRVNYIAVNLMRNDFRKKDLDMIANHSLYDEINFAYIAHFRQLNRLVDIRIETFMQKVRVRLIRSKNALKMRNEQDVRQLLGPLEPNLDVDISQFTIAPPTTLTTTATITAASLKNADRTTNHHRKSTSNVSQPIKLQRNDSSDDRGNLLFVVDDKIDIGDLILCVEDRTLTMSVIRTFVQSYLKMKETHFDF
jgi:hypothetical protein